MKPKFTFLPKRRQKSNLIKKLNVKLNKMKEKISNLTLEQAFFNLEGEDLINSAFVLKEVFKLNSQELYDKGKALGYFV